MNEFPTSVISSCVLLLHRKCMFHHLFNRIVSAEPAGVEWFVMCNMPSQAR